MTIEDKRKVIELLIVGARIGSTSAGYHLGGSSRHVALAIAARQRRQQHDVRAGSFMQWGLEAAYRLIESSPTLIREWFGRGAK